MNAPLVPSLHGEQFSAAQQKMKICTCMLLPNKTNQFLRKFLFKGKYQDFSGFKEEITWISKEGLLVVLLGTSSQWMHHWFHPYTVSNLVQRSKKWRFVHACSYRMKLVKPSNSQGFQRKILAFLRKVPLFPKENPWIFKDGLLVVLWGPVLTEYTTGSITTR